MSFTPANTTALIAALLLGSASLCAPALAAEETPLRACMQAAKWPLLISRDYVNGQSHRRQQVLARYDRDVAEGQAVCLAAARGEGDSAGFMARQKARFGARADVHLQRLQHQLDRLGGQS